MTGVLALQVTLACSHDETSEGRRELLQVNARAQARQERIDKARVRSPEGDILPSDEKVAGFVMPRGFTLHRTLEHRWIYDAQLPQTKVVEYFDGRLSGTKNEVPGNAGNEVEWRNAREKSDPNHVAGWVQVQPTPGKREWTRIIISEPNPVPPGTVFPRPEEELARRRASQR